MQKTPNMEENPNILFLYTEIAEYFLACCFELSKTHNKVVHIVRLPVNSEAPFQFGDEYVGLKFYERKNYNYNGLRKLVGDIHPGLIFCSGWIDKDYLKICKEFGKHIPTIITMDTQWRGDLKQRFACMLSTHFLLPSFSHAWVTGEKQEQYAKKLGFSAEKIRKGFYTCDKKHYDAVYDNFRNKSAPRNEKKLIYVGRYYAFKGLPELWSAFVELHQEEKFKDWELWCFGTGTLVSPVHSAIKHFGFVQPSQLADYLDGSGIFVIPSRFEPWGVVLHEFTCLGYPVVVSDKVGARELFVNEGINGFIFEANNLHSLRNALREMMELSTEKRIAMGKESRKLSAQLSPTHWAKTAVGFYE